MFELKYSSTHFANWTNYDSHFVVDVNGSVERRGGDRAGRKGQWWETERGLVQFIFSMGRFNLEHCSASGPMQQ